VLVYQSQLIF